MRQFLIKLNSTMTSMIYVTILAILQIAIDIVK